MKKYIIVFNLFLVSNLFITSSCSDDDVRYSVAPELETYVNTFISEAQERGVTIPKNNLVAELTDFKAQSVANSYIDGDQKYLYVHKGLFTYGTTTGKTDLIESNIFNALGGLLVQNSINLTTMVYDREEFFNELLK